MFKLSKVGRWSAAVFWMFLIFLFSSIPGVMFPAEARSLSLLVHFIEYFILATLLLWAANNGFSTPISASTVAAVFMIATVYGFTDEMHQAFVPYRVADAVDFFFDALGVTAACIAVPLLTAFVCSRKKGAAEDGS